MTDDILLTCPDLGLTRVHKGKVREVFALPNDRLLLVATDRLSAFDVVFDQGIPGKGRVLTTLSVLWFRATRGIIRNHLISADLSGLHLAPATSELLSGRSMIVEGARRIDVECVIRGYLAGSGWREYQKSQTVCGIPLPPGLRLNDRLPEPIFTPALKNDAGHDENVSEVVVAHHLGTDLASRLRDTSQALYRFAAATCKAADIILADTKFEFGWVNGELTLIDELFTPDSSRFWPAERYHAGEPIDSLDKEPLRAFVAESGWNMEPPAPPLPDTVVRETSARYDSALKRLQAILD